MIYLPIKSETKLYAFSKASSKLELITIASKSGAVANSAGALATRMLIFSSLSSPRSLRRLTNSFKSGGLTKMANVCSGNFRFIRRPPETSISNITCLPLAQMRSISVFRVP